jgi:hypothetical protein
MDSGSVSNFTNCSLTKKTFRAGFVSVETMQTLDAFKRPQIRIPI